MKKLVFIVAIVAFSAAVKAQDSSALGNKTYTNESKNKTYNENPTLDKKVIWSIGIEPSTPIGHFHNLAKFGWGASLQGEFKTSTNFGITLNGGYFAWSGKTADTIKYPNFKYWPVMAGLKYYMGKAFIHAQAGPGFGEDGLGTSFWYGAGLGVNFTKKVDAELRYMGWKQGIVNNNESSNGGGIYGGNPGGTPTGNPGGNPYGGHYSTLGIRLAVNF